MDIEELLRTLFGQGPPPGTPEMAGTGAFPARPPMPPGMMAIGSAPEMAGHEFVGEAPQMPRTSQNEQSFFQVPRSPVSHRQNGFTIDTESRGAPGFSFNGPSNAPRLPGSNQSSRGYSARGSSDEGNPITDMISGLFGGDPKRDRAIKTTAGWLQRQGMDAGTAQIFASDPSMLRSYVVDRYKQQQRSGQPDWKMETVYDAQGNEQKIRVDVNSGRYEPIGGSKSALMSPEEEAQKRRLAESGRSSINVGSQEGSYDKELGTAYGKRFTAMQEDATAGQRTVNNLKLMDQLMNRPDFYSGSAGNVVAIGKRFAASVGMDPNAVKDIESFNALSKQAALDIMGGSLGTGFSNADRDFVTGQVPTLDNSIEGNRQLVGIQKKLAGRKIEIAKLARQYAAKSGGRIDPGFDDHLAAWAEQNPLFEAPPTGQGRRIDDAGPSRVNNPAPGGPPRRSGAAASPRATNPQTGQTVEWNGSQWVPVQ